MKWLKEFFQWFLLFGLLGLGITIWGLGIFYFVTWGTVDMYWPLFRLWVSGVLSLIIMCAFSMANDSCR